MGDTGGMGPVGKDGNSCKVDEEVEAVDDKAEVVGDEEKVVGDEEGGEEEGEGEGDGEESRVDTANEFVRDTTGGAVNIVVAATVFVAVT